MYRDHVYFQEENESGRTHENNKKDLTNLIKDAETPLYPRFKKHKKYQQQFLYSSIKLAWYN